MITIVILQLFKALSGVKCQLYILFDSFVLSFLNHAETVNFAAYDKLYFLLDVVLCRQDFLRLDQVQVTESKDSLFEVRRTKVFNLRKVVQHVVFEVFGTPDAVVIVEEVEHEGHVLTVRNT